MSKANKNSISGVSIAWPTLALASAAIATRVGSTVAGATDAIGLFMAMAITTVGAFIAFTPVHEAAHKSLARNRVLNEGLGRICSLLLLVPFPAFRYVHLEHHKHTNDSEKDPDHWSGRGPYWALPLRWATQDIYYGVRYFRIASRRARAERIEILATFAAIAGTFAVLALFGHGLAAVLLWLVPARIAILLLAFSLDFLPHYPYETRAADDRYRATRVFPSPMLTPVTMYQNYHLIHHLYPGVPFYRMGHVWRERQQELVAKGAQVIALKDILASPHPARLG